MVRKITPLNIKDPQAYRMARELSERTGESLTEAVRVSLRERLEREKHREPDAVIMEKLLEISERCAALPVLDARSDEEILGYDEIGVPR